MLGIIQKIEEVYKCLPYSIGNWPFSYDGWRVKTDKHEFFLAIHNSQACCEEWGMICSDDNPDDLIGQELLDIELTNTALEVQSVAIKNTLREAGNECIQFMTLKTREGDFQLAVYNIHNGYYGHNVVVNKDGEDIFKTII